MAQDRQDSTAPSGSAPSSARRVVVAGSGIAGAETALTLALGLPDCSVTLVGRSRSVRLSPDLIYVPFGIAPRRIDVPVRALRAFGIHAVHAEVERIDVGAQRVDTSAGPIEYDVLVVAPGARPLGPASTALRSLDDALRLQVQMTALLDAAAAGERRTVTIHAESEDSWTAPACELALLIGAWMRAHGLERHIETLLATADRDTFEWFGTDGNEHVSAALERAGVRVATGVPAGRFDQLGGDVVVDFGRMEANAIPGLPGRSPASGWYEPQRDFSVAPDVHVVGDAINLPYRAGFASAWQARRLLHVLGGDLRDLGATVDGIPSAAVEYQMELVDGVLRARMGRADSLAHPFLGHDAEVTLEPGGRPDKLAGLLLHDRVLRAHATKHDAPLAFRHALQHRASMRNG